MRQLRISILLLFLPIISQAQYYRSYDPRSIPQAQNNNRYKNQGSNFRGLQQQATTDRSDVASLISRGLFNFTLNLERTIEELEHDGENIVLSPLCLQLGLATLLLGAGGQTHRELEKVLGISSISNNSSPPEMVHRTLSQLTGHYRNPQVQSTVSKNDLTLTRLASGLFVQDGFPIRNQFQSATKQFYGSEIFKVNFGQDGEMIRKRINSWVKDKTMNKIENILKEPPSTSTILMILSALYFKGEWMKPFAKVDSREFYVDQNETISVEMLENEAHYPYYSDDQLGLAIVGIPYKGSEVMMYAILPHESGMENLKNIKRRLTAEKLEEIISKMVESEVYLTIPKMNLSSTRSLRPALEKLGLASLFSSGHADLSGLSAEIDNSNREFRVRSKSDKIRSKRSARLIFPGPTNDHEYEHHQSRRWVSPVRDNDYPVRYPQNSQSDNAQAVYQRNNPVLQGNSQQFGPMIFPGPTESSLASYQPRTSTDYFFPHFPTVRPNPDLSKTFQNGRKQHDETFVYSHDNPDENYYVVSGPVATVWKHIGKSNHEKNVNDGSYQSYLTVPATNHQSSRTGRGQSTSSSQHLYGGNQPQADTADQTRNRNIQPPSRDQQSKVNVPVSVDSSRDSSISSNPGLYVEDFVHAIEMSVDEKGTEAAAVAIATIDLKMFSVVPQMRFNRPFMFFIRHNPTKNLLFWGTINKPTPHKKQNDDTHY